MADGSGDDVNVKFGASIDDLKDKIGQIGGLFGELTSKFAALAAVVAGGAAFKDFIDTANRVTSETVGLSKSLGVTGDEAAALNTALGDVGGTAETYTGAFQKFARQLSTNGDALKAMGVDVDGVRNGTVSGTAAFQQALGIVGSYKAGIDQTEASMKFFGRSVGDVQTLLKLTPALMEAARKKNEELNLNISQESVDAAKKYKLAMADVGDVLTGIKKTIGEEVIPIFTESAEQLASIGPGLVEGVKVGAQAFVEIVRTIGETVSVVFGVISDMASTLISVLSDLFGGEPMTAMGLFKTVLQSIEIIFIGFRIGVELLADVVRTAFGVMSSIVTTFGEVADRALHFDWEGAKSAALAGVDEVNRILQEGQDKAIAIAVKGAADINKAAGHEGDDYSHEGRGKTEYKPPGGDKPFKPVNKNADAEASARKALLKAQAEAELAIVKETLAEQQSAADDAYKQGLTSTKAYYDETLAITLAGTDAELATKRKELADAKALEASATKPEAKLKAAAQEAQIAGQINVLESKRTQQIQDNANAYRDAERERLDGLAAYQAALDKGGSDDQVAREKAALDQSVALRRTSAEQALQVDMQLENESYAALVASLNAKGVLIRGSEAEQAKARQALSLEMEGAEQAHQQKLTQISNQADLERSKYSVQAQQSVQSSFATMVNGFLSGTQKISDVFRQFAVNIANTFTNLISQKFTDKLFDATGVSKALDKMFSFVTEGISKMVTKWVGGEAANTAAATTGAATRKGITTAETAASVAADATATTSAATAETAQTAAAVTGDATRTASGEAATVTAVASQQTETVAAILGYAAEAAVAAMASVAAIPFVGWAMAPEVGAATYATGLAYLASAAGGWGEVPSDQLAQVHKKEMVLPAPLADGIRDMVSQGRKGGSSLPLALPSSTGQLGRINAAAQPSQAQATAAHQRMASGDSFAINVSAIDGDSVKKMLMTHGPALVKSLKNQARNNVPVR